MASQYGETRVYSSLTEDTDSRKKRCPLCKVDSVPRGISESGTNELNGIKVHCPNCGHTYGWDSLIDGRIQGIHVRSEGDVTTITVDGGTLQLYADVAPFYADNKKVAWTSSDEAVATVDGNGLVTALTNGTAVIRATSNEDATKYDELSITTSNQV